MTLKEYLQDYASPETSKIGEALIDREIVKVPDDKKRERALEYLDKIRNGERDFRF